MPLELRTRIPNPNALDYLEKRTGLHRSQILFWAAAYKYLEANLSPNPNPPLAEFAAVTGLPLRLIRVYDAFWLSWLPDYIARMEFSKAQPADAPFQEPGDRDYMFMSWAGRLKGSSQEFAQLKHKKMKEAGALNESKGSEKPATLERDCAMLTLVAQKHEQNVNRVWELAGLGAAVRARYRPLRHQT